MHPRTRYIAQCLGGATAAWLAPAAARALKRRLIDATPVPAARRFATTAARAPTSAMSQSPEALAVTPLRRPIASKRRVALGLACAGGLVTAPLGGTLVVAGVTSMAPDHSSSRIAPVASVADSAP